MLLFPSDDTLLWSLLSLCSPFGFCHELLIFVQALERGKRGRVILRKRGGKSTGAGAVMGFPEGHASGGPVSFPMQCEYFTEAAQVYVPGDLPRSWDVSRLWERK